MRRMLQILILIMSLTVPNAFAVAGEDGFELVRIRLLLNGYKLEMTTRWAVTLDLSDAIIEIEEINTEKIITRITKVPVRVRMLSRGLNFRMFDTQGFLCPGSPKCPEGRAAMKIIGLKNKKFGDVFGRYSGPSEGVSVLFNLGNTFVKKDKSSIFISDFEDIFAGFGFNLTWKTLLVLPPEGPYEGNIVVRVVSKNQTMEEAHIVKELSELMNTVFK
ncbi:MAG: hypothetical protein IT289_10250 [Oligoflexia bacterium]|nr:hypothetical protein [Oligoflexia bacterium]